MALSTRTALLLAVCFLACYASVPSLAASGDFLQCLSANIPSQLVFTPSSPSFTSVLVSSIRNPKFFTPTTVRPLCIVTPTNASHVQAAVLCGRGHDVRVRVRSDGHDYEGLSYIGGARKFCEEVTNRKSGKDLCWRVAPARRSPARPELLARELAAASRRCLPACSTARGRVPGSRRPALLACVLDGASWRRPALLDAASQQWPALLSAHPPTRDACWLTGSSSPVGNGESI
ncbi:hypothetical protein ACQ4PT_019148 [Festuca glaucescens]